jgi:hypothetical protein
MKPLRTGAARPLRMAASVFAAGCVAAGCAHLADGSVAPTPAPSATASAQAACNPTGAANAQVVAISPLITPTTDPTYGIVAGYGLVSGGSAGNVAAPVVVAPSATIQFFDDDQAGSQLRYSAVGIPNVSAFPGPSYTFPPAAAEAGGTQINATSSWSTGLLGGQCYSQTFTIAGPGTYFFGDETYYGLGNVRDVIVATSSPVP